MKFQENKGEKNQLQTVRRCFDSCGDARKRRRTPGISRTPPFPKRRAVWALDRERELILLDGLLHPGSKSRLQERFKQTGFGSLILAGSLLGFVVQVRLEDLGAQAGGKLCGLKTRKEERRETKPNSLQATELLKPLLLTRRNELPNQVSGQRQRGTQYRSFEPSRLCAQLHRTRRQRLPPAKPALLRPHAAAPPLVGPVPPQRAWIIICPRWEKNSRC